MVVGAQLVFESSATSGQPVKCVLHETYSNIVGIHPTAAEQLVAV